MRIRTILLVLLAVSEAAGVARPAELRSTDLGLTLDETARVTGLVVQGRKLAVHPAPFAAVCEAGARRYRPLAVTGGDRRTTWLLRSEPAGVRAALAVRPAGNALHFTCTVTGDSGPDRGLLLRFSLPVNAIGWKWYDDMQTARTMTAGKVYENVRPLRAWPDLPEWRDKPDLRIGYTNRNFCTVLTGPVGLCLAVPLDRPCIFRTAYDAGAERLEIVYDFALSSATAVPYQANFAFDLFPCDPAWGFRSALEKYYHLYPRFFQVYVTHPGQWMAFSRLSEIDNANEFLFRLQEGAPEPEYDDKIDVLSAVYFTHAGMFARIPGYDPEKDPLPPYEKQLAAMKAAFKRRTGRDGIYEASGLFTAAGRFDIRKARVYGHIIAQFDLDPDLPYGAWTLRRALTLSENIWKKKHARLDGFYYDGLPAGLDYRRAHFKTAAAPCLWDPVHKKAVLNNFFSSCKFARAAAETLRPQGRVTMMNGALQASFFVAPWLDLFGAETGLRIPREQFNYIRATTWHKPFMTLLKGNYEQKIGRQQIERFMQRCLAYGVFPGFFDWPPSGLGPGSRYWDHPAYYERDRDLFRKYEPLCRLLAEAGWEPVTWAHCSTPGLYIERFGPDANRVLWLTVLNESPDGVAAQLTVQPKRMGLAPDALAVTDRVTGNPIPCHVSANSTLTIPVTVPGNGVLCLQIAAPADAARLRLTQALATLDRGIRMRKVESAKPAVPVHWRPSAWEAGSRAETPNGPVLEFNPRSDLQRAFRQWVMLFQEAPAPLTLHVRVSADHLQAAPGRAGIRCRLAWVSPSFTHYQTAYFDFPAGTYSWRDLKFPLRSSHPLRAVLVQPELRPGVRGRLRIARISLQDATGREYAVDPDLKEWYEPPPPSLRPRIHTALRELRTDLIALRAAADSAPLRTPLIAAARRCRELRSLITREHAENGCRRVLRDLETVERHLAAIAPYAFGIPAPALRGPSIVPAGGKVHLTFPPPRIRTTRVQTTIRCAGARVIRTPDGADLAAPPDAAPGTVLTVRAALTLGTGADALTLSATRQITVEPPVEFTARIQTVDSETGVCRLGVAVRNHLQTPLSLRVQVEPPPGWRANLPADAARPLAPGARRRYVLTLVPSPQAAPGATDVRIRLRAGNRVLEQSVHFPFIPKSLNRVRNPGFEQGLRHWSTSGSDVTVQSPGASGARCARLANPGTAQTTVSQSIRLNQRLPAPIVIRASSRAQSVSGAPSRGYSLYVDLYYTDGTPLYGTTYDFPTGTTDWNSGELVFEPPKPIRDVNIYLLLRGRRGQALFDDIALMEAPDRKGNVARLATVTADSSFSRYSVTPVTDGRVYVDGLHWSKRAWASADNEKAHYLVFTFPAPQPLARGAVYWAVDAGAVKTSREIRFQAEVPGGAWKTVAVIHPRQGERRTTFRFPAATATRFRLFQPAGMGPKDRPGIFWVREVELFPPASHASRKQKETRQ